MVAGDIEQTKAVSSFREQPGVEKEDSFESIDEGKKDLRGFFGVPLKPLSDIVVRDLHSPVSKRYVVKDGPDIREGTETAKLKEYNDKLAEVPRYPDDVYSFIAMGLVPGNYLPFFYGIFVYLFQMGFLLLMILSKASKKMSANEDVDNPEEGNGFHASFIPAEVSLIVRTTQFFALLAFVVFADETMQDFVSAVEFFPWKFRWSNSWDMVSCFLRLTQSTFASLTVLLLVVTSPDVIDIVLNFTAVNFVSAFDGQAFELAQNGRYGNALKVKADIVTDQRVLEYKCFNRMAESEDENGDAVDHTWMWYVPTIGAMGILLVGWCAYIAGQQHSEESWTTKKIRVQFNPDTQLEDYSGCLVADGKNTDKRMVYKSDGTQKNNKLEYCKAERKWVFLTDPESNPCDPGLAEFAESAKTNSFDIATAFEIPWLSPFKKPLDMYFVDADEDQLFCTQFQNDGVCNSDLNINDYQYDGGDCCGTTCGKPGCGERGEVEAFGQKITGDSIVAFPTCVDKAMKNITFYLEDPIFGQDYGSGIAIWEPTLELKCGDLDRTVFSVPIDELMMGGSYDVQVDERADCTLTKINFNPVYGRSSDMVTEEASYARATVKYEKKNKMPKSSAYKEWNGVETIKFDNYTITGVISTEIGELESLENIILGQNLLTGTLPTEIGSLQNLKNLYLDDNNLQGTIPSEIALLTSLKALDLRNNQFTGTIPKEIESMSNLAELYLDGNSLLGFVNCTIMDSIVNVEECNEKNSFRPDFSSEPTTSPVPTEAPTGKSAPPKTSSPTSEPTLSPTAEPTAEPTVSFEPTCNSVGDVLCATSGLEAMCEFLLSIDGAEEALANSTWTIFAPTNDGLKRFLDTHDDAGASELESVFWFHTIAGEEMRRKDLPCFAGMNLVTMANGRDSRTLCNNEGKAIAQKGLGNRERIPVVKYNINACNGVIHTIEDVLLTDRSYLEEVEGDAYVV